MDYIYLDRPVYFLNRLTRYLYIDKKYYIIAAFIAIFVICVLKYLKKRLSNMKIFLIGVITFYLILIFAITVFNRNSGISYHVSFIPFHSVYEYSNRDGVSYLLREDIYNMIMFIPFGLLEGLIHGNKCKYSNVLIKGLSVSFGIELLQLLFSKGNCDIDDLIFNVIGCIVGFGIYKLIIRIKNLIIIQIRS